MPHYSGAEILIAQLERHGITIMPGIPGGSNLPIYDALFRSNIRHVLCRHEQGAGFVAQGIARSSRSAAACLVTSGPGATNLITAIADAYADSVPLVAIAGQVPTDLLGTDAFQEIDLSGMAMSIAKHVFLPRSPGELASDVVEAFALAQSGRPGPVVIDVPKDVQLGRVFLELLPPPASIPTPPAIDERAIAQALTLMKAAKRPVLYLGGGASRSDSARACEELAKIWDAPVALSLMALGAISVDSPYHLGLLGMHGAVTTNRWVAESDLILAVGARFNDRASGRPGTLCPNARVIHVDIDPTEHGKLQPTDVVIRGDALEVVSRLICGFGEPVERGSVVEIARVRAQDPNRLPQADRMSSRGVLTYMADMLGEDAFVVTDVGQHQMRVAQSYPFRRPERWLTSGGLGTMGFGVPAALGVALAHKEAEVVCFTGDGSLMMNVQELATVAEARANLTIVVSDNQSLGLVGQQQDLFFGERRFGCDYERPTDSHSCRTGFRYQHVRPRQERSYGLACATWSWSNVVTTSARRSRTRATHGAPGGFESRRNRDVPTKDSRCESESKRRSKRALHLRFVSMHSAVELTVQACRTERSRGARFGAPASKQLTRAPLGSRVSVRRSALKRNRGEARGGRRIRAKPEIARKNREQCLADDRLAPATEYLERRARGATVELPFGKCAQLRLIRK
ncbi:MAG: thiamine pyrophosphate-binding protein [Polyangiaceae bacterium]